MMDFKQFGLIRVKGKVYLYLIKNFGITFDFGLQTKKELNRILLYSTHKTLRSVELSL